MSKNTSAAVAEDTYVIASDSVGTLEINDRDGKIFYTPDGECRRGVSLKESARFYRQISRSVINGGDVIDSQVEGVEAWLRLVEAAL